MQPNVVVNGFFATDRIQQGRTVQAAIAVDIPEGFHVNSNKPLEKALIPTTVKIDAPGGIKIGPIIYPRALLRSFKFSKNKLAVYEGRAVMRFNVTVPSKQQLGVTELRVRVRYQSCNDEVCFPPATREITLPIAVVGPNEPVKRINGQFFGGGGGRRRG